MNSYIVPFSRSVSVRFLLNSWQISRASSYDRPVSIVFFSALANSCQFLHDLSKT